MKKVRGVFHPAPYCVDRGSAFKFGAMDNNTHIKILLFIFTLVSFVYLLAEICG